MLTDPCLRPFSHMHCTPSLEVTLITLILKNSLKSFHMAEEGMSCYISINLLQTIITHEYPSEKIILAQYKGTELFRLIGIIGG